MTTHTTHALSFILHYLWFNFIIYNYFTLLFIIYLVYFIYYHGMITHTLPCILHYLSFIYHLLSNTVFVTHFLLQYIVYTSINMPTSYTNSGCEQREAHTNWSIYGDLQKAAPVTGTLPWGLLTLCRQTLGSERHRYTIAWPDKLGTDPIAHGGLNK